ncbi:MAG: hypothetical protein PCFJNLEI_03910 [Verrucomicrobiae bacterium]|nr:hypothetical protein [Verrucomicrobiae bacterium]
MSDDVKLCAKSRKVVAACWLDISRVRIRVTRGIIHLQGTVIRIGEDPRDPEANEPYLEKLDEQLHTLPGFRAIQYTFDNWRRETNGSWRYLGKKPRSAKKR